MDIHTTTVTGKAWVSAESADDAVNSYVFFGHWTMSSKKAEIRILALFPCLRKINTEN